MLKDFLEKYSGNLTSSPAPLLDEGSRSSVHQQVYEEIRESILSSVFEPGQQLVIEDLASSLAVGSAPVREALLRLETEDLVDFNQYRGYTVSSFSLEDLKEIYFLRVLLEGVAADLAAHNLTEEELKKLKEICDQMEEFLEGQKFEEMPGLNVSLHEAIYSAAKSPRLYKLIVHLWNSYPKSSISVLTLRAPVMVSEHRAIFEALKSRDPGKSEKMVRDHIKGAFIDLADYWSHCVTTRVEDER